jgi:hypothetical protein
MKQHFKELKMYRLTERRFTKAKPILDQYRKQLHDTGSILTRDFEMELRKCWKIGYQELKSIIIELSKQNRYRYLAARYMESGSSGVVTEFQSTLAKMYGIKSFYHSPEKDSKRQAFWKKLKIKRSSKPQTKRARSGRSLNSFGRQRNR